MIKNNYLPKIFELINKSNLDERIKLPKRDSWPETYHIFDRTSINAIKAALAAERPLLVRGEPGTGKSQLARAAAFILKRTFVSKVVNAGMESTDLQYTFDAVSRLGEAQALSAVGAGLTDEQIRDKLDHKRFISPEVLWWAFDYQSAQEQFTGCHGQKLNPGLMKGCGPDSGCVVLIDEIDKAEADLPNGLLETLGNGAFTIPYLNKSIGLNPDRPAPLVVITTNEERELPAAFIRRCLVLNLHLSDKEDDLKKWLTHRGRVHFKNACSENVMSEAAAQLINDRKDAAREGLAKPGQAEYLDLLRAVIRISAIEAEKSSPGAIEECQRRILAKIKNFALRKNPLGQ